MARRRWDIETIKSVVDGGSPFIQSGYTGKTVQRKDGDSWKDSKNIKWKKENGVVKRVNDQADSIRNLIKQKCSSCGFDVGVLGNRLDSKMYAKTGMCLDCTQARELEMMIEGKLDKFSESKIIKNKLSLAKEFRKNVLESIEYLKKDNSKMEMVHSDGTITTWVGSQNEKLLKECKSDLEKVNKLISELEEEVKKL